MLTSAVLRGAYHLYQGIGAFVGNVVMGVVFALFFARFKRVLPLVVAHTILDVASFVGYALLKDRLDISALIVLIGQSPLVTRQIHRPPALFSMGRSQ